MGTVVGKKGSRGSLWDDSAETQEERFFSKEAVAPLSQNL